MTVPGDRDRVRELLDAVLDDGNTSLAGMAASVHASEFHFNRQVSRFAGESPVAMRRRVMLERAAWYLRRGHRVTDVAFDSGYESVEGFSRAFARAYGHPPSAAGDDPGRGHWLPAPNGIHFHSPTGLYVEGSASSADTAGNVVALMVRHDLDDTAVLLDAAKQLDRADYSRIRLPGNRIVRWPESDDSVEHVLIHLVTDKVPWLTAIEGSDMPETETGDLDSLVALHHQVAGRWLSLIRDIDRRGTWSDRVIDAICDPPQSFLLSEIVSHVMTFAAHRRMLLRMMLVDAGLDMSAPEHDPDLIIWHRRHSGGL
ncbi:helix-turn-helix domain-containing protein [Gordonia sp. DT30]|uniref:helix-turn-helix domain-containing protein n=1 Tax=unclassified Gordonia (in: high G+C Gram-positive bacteria) TaxID=2657482 RepID=UPI003CEC5B77